LRWVNKESTNPELAKVIERSGLVDSLFTHRNARRFMNDFVEMGAELYRLFLSPFTQLETCIKNAFASNSPLLINIQTGDHEINRLPWELLYAPEHYFLATSPHFQIIRSIEDNAGRRDACAPRKETHPWPPSQEGNTRRNSQQGRSGCFL